MAVRSPRTFLDLPTPVRHRIYEEAGLVRPCPIDLRHEQGSGARRRRHQALRARLPANDPSLPTCPTRHRADKADEWPDREGSRCLCAPLPTALLFVSRAAHADAEAVLYGRNAFRLVVDRHTREIGVLHRLSDATLRALTSLHLCITTWPCPKGHDLSLGWRYCFVCQEPARADDCQQYGERGPEADRYLLSAWYTLAKRLRAHLVPGRVRWSFVCDCTTPENARKIARYLCGLPRAREAAVRLGRAPQSPTAQIAREAALWMVHRRRAPASGPISPSFAELPRELRLQVLVATGLAAASQAPFNLPFQRVAFAEGGFRVAHRKCCTRCTPTLEPCCCPTRYAAASASCRCAPQPATLLAVSRTMRTDTYDVLLNANVVAFTDAPDDTLSALRALPPDVLRQFRRVRLELDHREHILEWKTQGLDSPWRALIAFIQEHFDLARLGLAVNQSNSYQNLGQPAEPEEAEGPETFRVYARSLLPPLRALRGLRSFHVRLGWFRDLERPVEEMVMGPEYDPCTDPFFPKDRASFDRAWPIPEGWSAEEEEEAEKDGASSAARNTHDTRTFRGARERLGESRSRFTKFLNIKASR